MLSIQFRIDREILLEAYTTYEKNSTSRRLRKIISVPLLLAGVLVSWFSVATGLGFLYVFFPVGLIVIAIAEWFHLIDLGKTSMSIKLNSSQKFKDVQSFRFSYEVIQYSTDKPVSTIRWSYYSGFLESRNAFLLIHGKKRYTIIPKSAMDAAQLSEFRKILSVRFP
jgi:YcxB-like protein